MIVLLCALRCEAAPFLQRYQMKRDPASLRFSLYQTPNGTLRLLLTGAGMLPAATAMTYYCTKYGVTEDTHFVNVGTACGTAAGEVYLANRLFDMTVQKTFYPDMICRNSLNETLVATSPVVITDYDAAVRRLPPALFFEVADTPAKSASRASDPPVLSDAAHTTLFDMEAAAIFQAGSRFLSPHQMSFVKIVSDSGEPLTEQKITALMEEKTDVIDGYLHTIQKVLLTEDPVSAAFFEDDIRSFAEAIHASETMTAQVRQLFTYLSLNGTEIQEVIRRLYENGSLPCASKRDGKKILDDLTKKLLP